MQQSSQLFRKNCLQIIWQQMPHTAHMFLSKAVSGPACWNSLHYNILIKSKGVVGLDASPEPLQVLCSPIRSYCWQSELTALSSVVGSVKSLPPQEQPSLCLFCHAAALLFSGAIREMKHLVPYACRLFGNSDAAISWHGVAYILPVNYRHDIKTGSKLQMQHC